jgi:hypothetical protein
VAGLTTSEAFDRHGDKGGWVASRTACAGCTVAISRDSSVISAETPCKAVK